MIRQHSPVSAEPQPARIEDYALIGDCQAAALVGRATRYEDVPTTALLAVKPFAPPGSWSQCWK